MKPEARKTFYISVAMIFLLSVVSLWRMRNVDYSDVSFSFPESERSATPSLESLFSEERLREIAEERGLLIEEKEKDIIYTRKAVDEKIVFDYPSSWKATSPFPEEENVLQPVFLAYSQTTLSPIALTIFKTEETEIKNVIELFQGELEKEGVEITKMLTEKKNGEEYLLEINYGHPGEEPVVSFSKIILFRESAYMVLIAFFEGNPPSSDIIDYILSSLKKKN